tara:strand:- start:216 stop:791 length:576 start_codon:yes stop_codon:yes gene_type:complete
MARVNDRHTGQPIFPGSHGVGLGNVGSYQASGTPFLTASTIGADADKGTVQRIEFPRVAKSVTVQVIPHSLLGGATVDSSPITVTFGEPREADGTLRVGENVYQTNGTNAPMQYINKHGYTLQLVSGSADGPLYGEKITFGVRTDHVNISVNGFGSAEASGSFQVYAELTNIPAERMADNYISGSGVNVKI